MLERFLDRERGLRQLHEWWDEGRPELITMYGRRQIGKTELLVRFISDKPAIYFYADQQPVADHLRAFTEQVIGLHDDAVLRIQPFSTWDAALTYVLRLAEERRVAIVLDEFSYAVDSDSALPSIIQRLWDTARRAGSKAFIILCTSFAEATERHFRVDGPLYQRRTRDMRIEPFNYQDATLFFPDWSRQDRICAWGVVGGVPSYLQMFRGATLAEAVTASILDKSAVLYREAETLLAQEVRGIGPATLHGMLQAIAYGPAEPNAIAQRVGRPTTSLSGALGFLVDYGLLERRSPFDVPNPERTRLTRYYIADNYLAFWFRFVLPNRSALEQSQAHYVWQSKIAPELNTYMGPRFEALCRQYIRLHPERWSQRVGALGVWWRANDELDIVAHDAGRVTLAGEVKWNNDPVGLETLQTLQRRVALLSNVAPECQLVLFSRSGFTPAVQAATTPYTILVTLEDLLP